MIILRKRGNTSLGILDRFFKREKSVTKSSLYREPASGFSQFSGDAYSNDIYREAVDAIARNIGKLKGSHVVTYSGQKSAGDARLNRLLQTRPNPYMSAYDLLYKLTTRLYLYNNAFAYLDKDDRGNVRAIYPVTASRVDVYSDGAGSLFCGFMLKGGREVLLPYGDIIHLRRFFNDNDLLGADNGAISSGLELAHVENAGVTNAIKAGASIRGILSFTQIMSPEKLKEEKAAFVKDYLEMDNSGGVVATDQKMMYTPIDHKPVILDAEQAKAIKTKIYNYLGLTEQIVNSSYTEDEYAAFYESTLEPIAIALSQEFTAKVFNEREQAFGNAIVFESGRLQFSNNKTKIRLIAQLLPYGLLTINQALDVLNLPSVPDGDRRLQALNLLDQSLVNDYLVGGNSVKKIPENEDQYDYE